MVSLTASLAKFQELRQLWPLFKIDFVRHARADFQDLALQMIFVVSLLLTVCYDMAEGLTLTVFFAIFTTVARNQWFI